MLNCLIVGAGGFLGSVFRYLMGMVPVKETTVFPIKTLVINVVGCFVIGCITGLAARNAALHPKWMLFLKTGLCGGFTTFSTFALESSDLIKSGYAGLAVLYMGLSLLLGIGSVYAAQFLVSR